MDQPPPLALREPGRVPRLIPLLPIAAYVGLAVVMASAYETDAIWAPSCQSVGIGVECPPARSLWLSLAVLWTVLAVSLGALVVLGWHRTRRGRGIYVPPRAMFASALTVAGIGGLWLWATNEAGYGRVPRALDTGLLLAFVTASLFLFGVAFAYDRPWSDGHGRWGMILAAILGLLGLILAYLFSNAVLNPPVFA